MGTKSWQDYFQSVQIEIGNLGISSGIYEDQIKKLETKAEGNTLAARKGEQQLNETRELLGKTGKAIDELKELYETTKEWGKPSQRVIGHIIRSPAITVDTLPHGFTKDLAIIKLDKEKFRNIDGNMNVLDLGAF